LEVLTIGLTIPEKCLQAGGMKQLTNLKSATSIDETSSAANIRERIVPGALARRIDLL
jgi:hypothetical protein